MKKLFVLTVIFSLITLTAQSQTFTVPVSVTSSTYPQLLVNSSSTSSSTGISLKNASNYQYEIANHTTNYFYVFDRTAQQYRFAINSSGNVGIGTITPTYKLHVNSTTNGWASMVQNQGCIVYSAYGQGTTDGYGMHIRVNNTRNDRYALQIYDGTNNLFYVRNDGNVGIGTANPDFKLTVNGNIKAEYVNIVSEVVSDYVFEKDYKLLSLKDLENFVKTEKHLPDVPSATEFKETGYSVGQMDDLLLRKVEELTLYTIEQQKLIEEQQKQTKTLLEAVDKQQQEIEGLKKQNEILLESIQTLELDK